MEQFQTRIRGVTEKPRVQVDCRNWVTEFKSCSDTMTRIEVDAEYCESVDYRGRPIGEYGKSFIINVAILASMPLLSLGYWLLYQKMKCLYLL